MRTITVVGHGTFHASPDTAEIRVAAVHRDTGLSEALAGAESARSGVVATARRYVDPARIASTDLGVWPAHDNGGGPSGFEARHSLSIAATTSPRRGARDCAGCGRGAPPRGRGRVAGGGGPSEAARVARERAVADAGARAEHLAGLAGVTLGEVQSVTERGAGRHQVFDFAEAGAACQSRLTLDPGETVVSASLTVSFELATAR